MAKLHEILAVESNLKGQAEVTRNDLKATFANKRHHFTKRVGVFKPISETEQEKVEETLDMVTTVPKELKWLAGIIAPALDAAYQVAEANTRARADVIIEGGPVLLQDVPATALLELEKRVAEIHDFVSAIPTLDPAKGFTPDPSEGEGVFKARIEAKQRTKKDVRVITLAPPTDKHPAQVQAINVDVPTGELVTQEWSGLITTAAKGDMLERVEKLRRAVKAARSRANEVLVDQKPTIGKRLLDYVFGH